jgi:hypothetical protein
MAISSGINASRPGKTGKYGLWLLLKSAYRLCTVISSFARLLMAVRISGSLANSSKTRVKCLGRDT